MKKGLFSLVGGLFLITAVFAAAQDGAKVYIVHGVPGPDVGAPDIPFFPVDVLIDDVLTIQNFELGRVMGPVAFTPGPDIHKVTVKRAKPEDPGNGELVMEAADLMFEAGRNYSVVVHLNADGSGVTASVFENTFGPAYRTKRDNAGRNKPRLIIHNTAAAGPTDILATRQNPDSSGGPKMDVSGLENDGVSQAIADVRPGSWILWIGAYGTGERIYGPWQIELKPFTTYLIYPVGSLVNNTCWLIKHPIGVHREVALRGKDAKSQVSAPRKTIKRSQRRR